MLPDFKRYYKAIVIKIYDIGIKTYINQWNRVESSKNKSMQVGSINLNKESKNIQWNDSLLSGIGETGYTHAQEWDWTTVLHYTQNWLKVDYKLEHKTESHKTSRRKHKR